MTAKYKFEARAGKNKFEARVVNNKLGVSFGDRGQSRVPHKGPGAGKYKYPVEKNFEIIREKYNSKV